MEKGVGMRGASEVSAGEVVSYMGRRFITFAVASPQLSFAPRSASPPSESSLGEQKALHQSRVSSQPPTKLLVPSVSSIQANGEEVWLLALGTGKVLRKPSLEAPINQERYSSRVEYLWSTIFRREGKRRDREARIEWALL